MNLMKAMKKIVIVIFVGVVMVLVLGLAVGLYSLTKPSLSLPHRFHFERQPMSYRDPFLVPPTRRRLEDGRRAVLEPIFEELARAYTDCRFEVLCDWAKKLPNMVMDIADGDFREVAKPVLRIVDDLVLLDVGKPVSIPLQAEDFVRNMKTECALLRLFGEMRVKRKDLGTVFSLLESARYKRLVRFRDKFGGEGRRDLEACAERLVSEWIEQIESPNGYTRILAEYYLAIEKETAYMAMIDNDIDWQSCIRGVVVSSAGFLVRAGYTPKWLSEIERTPEPKVWPVYD